VLGKNLQDQKGKENRLKQDTDSPQRRIREKTKKQLAAEKFGTQKGGKKPSVQSERKKERGGVLVVPLTGKNIAHDREGRKVQTFPPRKKSPRWVLAEKLKGKEERKDGPLASGHSWKKKKKKYLAK